MTIVFSPTRRVTNRRISCLVFGFLDVATAVDSTTKIRAIVVGRLSDSSDSARGESEPPTSSQGIVVAA
jgi:hypothetical protein